MRTVTLEQLRDRLVRQGEYDNSSTYTTPWLNDEINEAIGEYWALLTSAWDDRFTTFVDLSLTGGSETVALPADFWKARKITYVSGGKEAYRLRALELSELHWYQNFVYTSNSTIRLWYIPAPPILVNDTDTIDGYAGFEKLIVELALVEFDRREKQPTSDREREITRLTRKIRSAADGRDSSEPWHPQDLGSHDVGGHYAIIGNNLHCFRGGPIRRFL